MDLSSVYQFLAPVLSAFLSASSRTHWMGLAVFAVVWMLWNRHRCSIGSVYRSLQRVMGTPSTHLDIQLLVVNRLLATSLTTVALYSTWWVSISIADLLYTVFETPAVSLSGTALVALYSALLFVVEDGTRFLLHRALHRYPVLWRFHSVHHSATTLTPLTFFRVHPIESILYRLRSVLSVGVVAGCMYWLGQVGSATETVSPYVIFGVPAVGFLLNTIVGNLRHSHIFLSFGSSVERWLISPAQHQLHHSAESKHWNRNFGTWLAIWDRWSDTLLLSDTETPETITFGLGNPSTHSLVDALVTPFKGASQRLGIRVMVITLITFCSFGVAYADETEDSEDANEESAPSAEIIVYDDDQIKEAGSAHKVSEEVLSQFEFNDIQQVMSMVPGVSTRTEDGFGLRPNIGIRGANSDRSAKVTLMEDGVLFAPAPYAAPAAYFFPMTTRLVGVEVFKGAASTRYGPQTVGGAVNVLTRAVPTDEQWGGDVSYGAFNTLKAHGFVGRQIGQWGVLAEASHLQSDGFKQLASSAPTGFSRTDTLLKMKRGTQRHTLEMKFGFAREESNETYLGLSQRDFEDTPLLRYPASQEGLMEWTRTQAEVSLSTRLQENWLIRTVAYHHYLDRSWRKFNGFANGIDVHRLLLQDPTGGEGALYLSILRGDTDALLPEEYLQIGINDRSFHSFGVQSTSVLEHASEKSQHRLEMGIRLHGDLVQRLHTENSAQMVSQEIVYVENTQTELLNSHVGALALALYAHDDWQIGQFHLFPSMRNETIQTTTDVLNWQNGHLRSVLLPGMGTMWELDDWVDIFASAHRGFSPVAPEQEAAVLPEVSWNYEVGLRQHLDATTSELIVFANDYQRITGQCTLSSGCDVDDVGRQFTGGRALTTGVETLFRWDIWLQNGWTMPLQAQYTYTHATFREAFQSGFPQFGVVEFGNALPYVARHQGSTSIGLRTEETSVQLMGTYRGKMLDAAADWNDDSATIPQLWTMDLSGSKTVYSDWEVYGTWNNVTNVQAVTSWRPFGARPVTPSSLYLGVKRAL